MGKGGNVVCQGSSRLGLHARSCLLHCAATVAGAPYVTYVQQSFCLIYLFSCRSDQMLEDIIFKLVPGLQESEPVFLIACVCFYTFSQLSKHSLYLFNCLSLSFQLFHLQATCIINFACGLL